MQGLIDLHLHLDGSLSVETVRQLAAQQGLPVPQDPGTLRTMLSVSPTCRDLNEYLSKFDFPLSLLQTEAAMTTVVDDLIHELHSQGLIYAEIRFAPALHTRQGLTQDQVVQAALRGLRGLPGIPGQFQANFILCCMRGADTYEANLETVRVAHQYLGQGVVGVDLAGAEGLWGNEHFTEEIRLAKTFNLPFTLHAGEARGWESVESALDLGAARIGHGVRAVENPDTLKRLADSQVPLELCPTSNLQTQTVSTLAQYPLRRLLEAGVRVTINTDNMTVSDTTLAREWQQITQAFHLTEAEILGIQQNSIDAAFADAVTKQAMRRQLFSN